jgi:hypothetical protein
MSDGAGILVVGGAPLLLTEKLEGLLYEERNRGVKETLLHPG